MASDPDVHWAVLRRVGEKPPTRLLIGSWNMAVHADLKLVEHDEDGVDLAFRADVLRGLAERQKAVPARWLYDLAGSRLFEEITRQPEYYPTRTETRLLEAHGAEIARLTRSDLAVVEFGSGSSI